MLKKRPMVDMIRKRSFMGRSLKWEIMGRLLRCVTERIPWSQKEGPMGQEIQYCSTEHQILTYL